MLKDIFDSASSRIKTPYFGYFIFFIFTFNWKEWAILFLSDSSFTNRLEHFEVNTSLWSLIIWPLTAALVITIINPWFRLLLLKISYKPNVRINKEQAKSESETLQVKAELERERAIYQKIQEERVISEAETDSKIASIEDEKVRVRAKEKVDELRQQKDTLGNKSSPPQKSKPIIIKKVLVGDQEFNLSNAIKNTAPNGGNSIKLTGQLTQGDTKKIIVETDIPLNNNQTLRTVSNSQVRSLGDNSYEITKTQFGEDYLSLFIDEPNPYNPQKRRVVSNFVRISY